MSIEVRQARRAYRRRRAVETVALDGIDLTVGEGELVVVVGPSGSGKSTLLRSIAGLEPLDSGTVAIGGRDVSDEPPGRRDISMVFQDYALLPHLTVADNIAFGERARGVAVEVVRDKVQRVAEALGLAPLLHRRPRELSGGEQQRVALARAIVREPRAFLMDEPLSSLDADLRVRARAETRTTQRRLGVAMLYVTHDQTEAMALADRLLVLRAGRVEQQGSPEEVHARPANMFVARFMGALPMNLFPAVDGVVLGVRPERVVLSPVSGGKVRGDVAAVEPAGEEAVVRVRTQQDELLARVAWAERPRIGEPVGLTWAPEDEHCFAAGSGDRLP